MDYTDNQGWAKLDARSALQLADMISHFSETTKDARTRMLLFCFSRLSNSKLPAFSLGYRTIAKECNVSDRQAYQFLAYCEKYGYIEKIGTPKQGGYQKRAFTWMLDYLEDREQEGATKTKRKREHIRVQSTQRRSTLVLLALTLYALTRSATRKQKNPNQSTQAMKDSLKQKLKTLT